MFCDFEHIHGTVEIHTRWLGWISWYSDLLKPRWFRVQNPVELSSFTPVHSSPEVYPFLSGAKVYERVELYSLWLHVILQGELFNFL
jgi:hypothetical protein